MIVVCSFSLVLLTSTVNRRLDLKALLTSRSPSGYKLSDDDEEKLDVLLDWIGALKDLETLGSLDGLSPLHSPSLSSLSFSSPTPHILSSLVSLLTSFLTSAHHTNSDVFKAIYVIHCESSQVILSRRI